MTTMNVIPEQPSLSKREISILVALAAKPLHAYALARQCDDDSAGEGRMSNGTLYPALARLAQQGAIEQVGEPGRSTATGRKIWRLSRMGRLTLELELASYRRLVRLGHERL